MLPLAAEMIPWLQYATPPLVGAFIGYLTNRIAIRMLFRPLRAWHLAGIRVPMTPGVIPSKRCELAKNMGEVVGDHLLTHDELRRGLQQAVFQEHLGELIRGRLDSLMQRELSTIESLVPARFKVYFSLADQTVRYQLKGRLHQLLRSPQVGEAVAVAIDRQFDRFLEMEIDTVVGPAGREELYRRLHAGVDEMLTSPAVDHWLEDLVRSRVYGILQQEKSIADLVPEFFLDLLLVTLEKQIPAVLRQLARVVEEKEVQERVVGAVCEAVSSFIASLGGMAEMVRGFIRMERVEEKIRSSLLAHQEEIVAWLTSPAMQQRVAAILRSRARSFFAQPIVNMVGSEDEQQVNLFCEQCSSELLRLLRGGGMATALSSLLADHIEERLAGGSATIGDLLGDIFGEDLPQRGRLQRAIGATLLSEQSMRGLDSLVDRLFMELWQKKIGKLADILPAGVREGLAEQLLQTATGILTSELPGLVKSLNIRQIVTDRINSLDLLRLEGLLLAIMAEQFKYINLFGALLGFLIGCLNLFLLRGFQS